MDNDNDFKRKLSKEHKRIIIISIGLFAILVVVAILLFQRDQAIRISTRATIKGYTNAIPKDNRENIEKQVLNLIKSQYDIPKDTEIIAETRKDSIVEKVGNVSFLIDIDAYKLTFRVDVALKTDSSQETSDGIIISCPKINELKYPDQPCKGMYNTSTSLDLYLPYESKTKTGATFSAREYSDDERNKFIAVYVIACGDESLKTEALNLTKQYLTDNKLKPDDYQYKTIDSCTSFNGGGSTF